MKHIYILILSIFFTGFLFIISTFMIKIGEQKAQLKVFEDKFNLELPSLYEDQKELQKYKNYEKEITEIKDFVKKVMEIDPVSSIKSTKKEILINKIAETTKKYIKEKKAQELFIALLKIESNFDNQVKSNVGAIGISQIMPSSFLNITKICGFIVSKEDITDIDINLQLSACYFNYLIEKYNENPILALIEYNGGSKVAKQFQKQININKESANYILKIKEIEKKVKK